MGDNSKHSFVYLAISLGCFASSTSPLDTFLVTTWNHLHWQQINLIIDDLHPFAHTVMNSLQDLHMLHTEHVVTNVDSEFEFRSKENYVIVSDEPCKVMAVAEEYLVKHTRSSMLPHWSKFMIVVTSQHTSYLRRCLNDVMYDNVMVVFYDDVTFDVTSVETLMWRPNNLRSLSHVSVNIHSSEYTTARVAGDYEEMKTMGLDMTLFPNLKFGMNGRQLLCLCKTWPADLIVSDDPLTCELESE